MSYDYGETNSIVMFERVGVHRCIIRQLLGQKKVSNNGAVCGMLAVMS
jgi:hypothetical protein